jgi:hypothetical protein
MKTKLLILGALGAAALNVFAASQYVDSGNFPDSFQTYDTAAAHVEIDGVLRSANLTVTGEDTVYAGQYITLNNPIGFPPADVAALVTNGATLLLNNSTITSPYYDAGYGSGAGNTGIILFNNSVGALNNVSISHYVTGMHVENSTLTMTDGSITIANDPIAVGMGIVLADGSTVTLDNTTIVSTGERDESGVYSWGWYTTNTLNVTNGSVITGNIASNDYTTTEITLTGANTALHGDISTYGSSYGGSSTLTVGAGALFHGGGTVTNLNLADGATYKYSGDSLTITDSITIGNGVTIDLTNLNLAELENFTTVLDWSTAAGANNLDIS